MKKIGLLISTLLILLIAGKNTAQSLVCNDLVYISLDESCSHTIIPEEILEGIIFSNCIVELDKVAPFGNGPWVAGVLGPADIGKTYQVRVTHLPSGNKCWGNLKAEDKLPPTLKCNGLSTIDLNGGGPVSVTTTNLSIIATDGCSAISLSPTTLQYDCDDLGVNTVQLTATDVSGNTSTCLHSILVSNSTNCQTCVSDCPESVTVSYDEGNIDLLAAFQNNDWAAFDAYGNALFDVACNAVDSTYFVDYQVGTAGQNWFSRQWIWIDGTGQFRTCEQAIVFPATHTVTVQGKVYLDTDDDCSPDAGEQGVDHFSLVITKLPSGVSKTFHPAADGTYSTEIVFGVQDLSADLHLALPANVNPVCPTALNIPNETNTPSHNFDIGLQSEGDCPIMQVDLGNLFTRRCAINFFTVNYSNVGLDTAYGAFVTVNLDPLISLQSADLPYTVAGPDSVYTFQVGDVPPFHSGTIVVHAMVSCNAVPGQTLCNEATVFPDVPCEGAWQGAEVTATAHCSGDSVSLLLRNRGTQDMTQLLNYIVVEDFIMYKDGTFQLNAGDSITIKVPANGATWRIEAEQEAGFPVAGWVATAIEGCGGLNLPGLINLFGHSDNAITYDQDCSEVVASCDPNDKTAVPLGYNDQHFIRANEAIEYKIRFQNTGTDTAFKVIVVDTLSPLLDARTLEIGASSHPYRLEIYPGGILNFVFHPIILPDSNVNEVASHGYLKFSIRQQPDLADGTVIENTAAIYFDENDPVFTNTAFHTIGYPFIPNPPIVFSAQTLSPSCNGTADGAINVIVTGGVAPYSFEWGNPNLLGDSLSGLPAGTYQLTVTDSYRSEFVTSFELTEPAPVVVNTSSTPALGNDNGAATAVATGGTGAYSYLWNNGATTAQISGLSAGIYTVIVTDVNGCSQSNVVEVTQTILPLDYTSQTSNIQCNGDENGAIFLSASGGLPPYTVLWSDPTLQGDTLVGLPAGAYSWTLTDSNGSEYFDTFILTAPSPIVIVLNSTPALGNQNNGTASANASGGTGAYSYLWNNGATTENLSDLPAGTYSVIVTDANGCTQSNSVVVEQMVSTVEQEILSRIQVWPNPAHDRIVLDLHQVLPQLLRLHMLSADGRILRQWNSTDLQPLLTLDVESDQAGGLILLVLHGREGNIYTERIMIR